MRYVLWTSVTVALVVLAAAWWLGISPDRETGEAPQPAAAPSADIIERGRELVVLGGCTACHTARGGAPFAGGRPIPTRFGIFYSPNITPDGGTGVGSWSAADFWHALHNGYSKDGTLLYPTFPYTNYTRISRKDADAMYAYLRTIAPVQQANRRHEILFPYNHRVLLAAWRWLFFRPGVYQSEAQHDRKWNRGAYLVQGLAHCSACHDTRNALGATRSKAGPSGGLVLDWYAPALMNPHEAGVQDWSEADIITLLKTGQVHTNTANAAALGPMAEVVAESLQHTPDDELQAMAVYLKSLPVTQERESANTTVRYDLPPAVRAASKDLYDKHCADCHGDEGEGHAPAAPPLARNRVVAMTSAVDPIRMILFGGYSPGTAANPRPFGMPPFSLTLTDQQIADILNYVRTSWGNNARLVHGEEVSANRGNPLW